MITASYASLPHIRAPAVIIFKSVGYISRKAAIPAGREGVRNKDINGLLRWEFMPQQTLEFEMGASRQGNIYAGDSENNNGNAQTQALFGQETNRMYRQKYALTHRGYWDSGVSALSYFQYERTDDSRIFEPLAGGPAGCPTGGYYTDITLDAYIAKRHYFDNSQLCFFATYQGSGCNHF